MFLVNSQERKIMCLIIFLLICLTIGGFGCMLVSVVMEAAVIEVAAVIVIIVALVMLIGLALR